MENLEKDVYEILKKYRSEEQLKELMAKLSKENQMKVKLVLKLFTFKEEQYN